MELKSTVVLVFTFKYLIRLLEFNKHSVTSPFRLLPTCCLHASTYLHPLSKKLIQVSCHVEYAECIRHTCFEIACFVVKPVGIAFSVGVHFEQQVVVILIDQVCRVQIA